MEKNKRNNLLEIAQVFFKLGLFAFGGPAAHIAMMEEEIVRKRKWMDHQHFLDLMGATNLIPGPNSTEMTMHCGYVRGGVKGLFIAGFCFIFPAVILTGFLAFLYVEFGQVPQIEPFISGIKPAILAVILGAVFKLGKKALKNWQLAILAGLVILVSFLGVNEVTALLSAGLLGGLFFYSINELKGSDSKRILPVIGIPILSPIIAKTVLSTSKIFWTFLKVGSVLYGSGYVLFAYLKGELVEPGYLQMNELIDAIAVGQFTPGPVLSTATFIGYQLGGFGGAIAATLGIFLPSFLFVWMLNPLITKLRKNKFLSYFLDSVNVAAVAIMVVVLLEMSYETIINWQSAIIACLGIFFVFGPKKLSAIWIVIGGSALGYFLSYI
ncbi:MAG: chromate efflux transporter [Flavobacteriales bacterium]